MPHSSSSDLGAGEQADAFSKGIDPQAEYQTFLGLTSFWEQTSLDSHHLLMFSSTVSSRIQEVLRKMRESCLSLSI